MEFVDIDLPCNKFSLRLLANDSITYIKKRRIVKIEDKVNEALKVKATQEKKIPVKLVSKKSSKASIPISDLVGKSFPYIQALFMNTNIVILTLYFFLISPKFREETRRFMTVFQKSHRRGLYPLLFQLLNKR